MSKIITHINFAKGFRGGEKQTQLLIAELSKLNYHQKLLVRKGSQLTKRCLNIPNLKIIEISKPYIYHFKYIKDSTILHAHETKALQFAFLANIITKIPYIVTRRVDNRIKSNILNKKMYQNAKVSVALSKAIENEILKVSPTAYTSLIPSAFSDVKVNAMKANKIKERFKDKFIIGHIGALDDKHKGQSIIIEVAKKLEKDYPNILFLLVGGGDDEVMLKTMAKGLSNIHFEGFVNNVNDYISIFDMFLFPSRNEGLGSTLLDVINNNVVILANDVGGIPDIIKNNENGILFDIKDRDSIQKIILEIYNDSSRRELLYTNAKKTIDKYSAKNMAYSYTTLYKL